MTRSMALAIHGGCGTLAPELLTPDEWAELRGHLAQSLREGWRQLLAGASSVDAVEAAVVVMEESPHFNAGHGAALTENAEHELDASIMNGEDLSAGAVCLVRRIRNPIRAARAVMERSDCVLIAGAAADAFAERQGLEIVENRFFTTDRRVAALASLRQRQARGTLAAASQAERHGTVGAVALDTTGRLAAATSTGGFNNKPAGRIGDSPVIGAGTYAMNGVCAVSCTGQGEVFIRLAVAHEIAARIRHAGQSLEQAAGGMVRDDLSRHGIGAGLVAIDAQGHIQAPFNTLGMARGWVTPEGKAFVATHREIHEVRV